MYHIGRYEHNPFLEWLSQKAVLNQNENEKLGTLNVSKNSIVINWGQAEQFNCQKSNIKEVTVQFAYKEKKLKAMKTRHFEEMPYGFGNEKHLDCYPWDVSINITMKFERFLTNAMGCTCLVHSPICDIICNTILCLSMWYLRLPTGM